MTCALYRHFDADGALLYVGITNNPKRRLAEHKSRSVWGGQIDRVDVKWMRSREDALSEEGVAILIERPIFNGGLGVEYQPTGDALKDWMARDGITQAHLAESYGVCAATISQMISGKRRVSLRFALLVEDISEGAVSCRYWMFGATAEHHGSAGRAPSEASQ